MGDHEPPPTRNLTVAAVPSIGDIIIDRYRVERFVGSGGMAHVLGARHLTLGNEVAIKVLEPTLANDLEARERFAREARAMASLVSKHTVRVFDVGALQSGLPFMVMELLDGRDLNRELADRGPLPLDEACEYIDQACEAVAEAHANGIIHRDLKPHNLFLTKVKGKPFIRVLDFGIARTIKGGAVPKLETITRMGDVVGTLHYMAPEQIRNSASVEPRSDVWALGACLYKLITGFPPFPQQGEAPLMAAIMTSPPKPIGDYRKDVPSVLASVIMRCLRKPIEERFPTALELRKALGEAVVLMATGELVEKTELMPNLQEQIRQHTGRHPDTVRSAGSPSQGSDPKLTVKQKAFDKTLPINSPQAQEQVAARGLPNVPPSGSSMPVSSSNRISVPHPMPSTRSVPDRQSYTPSFPQQTLPMARPSSLSFVAIVAAVAIGVFVAGLGILFVLSRRH